jgi:hypothetical protein
MAENFSSAFDALKALLAGYADRFAAETDTPREYLLVSKYASPFPQHKGQPLHFACVKRGKAYVSFHLMALHMNPSLPKTISGELKKRMQGKTCFNFKSAPEPELFEELKRLTEAAFADLGKMSSPESGLTGS